MQSYKSFGIHFGSIFIGIIGFAGLFAPLVSMIAGEGMHRGDIQFMILFGLIMGFGIYMNLHARYNLKP